MVAATEQVFLPAPEFEIIGENFKVVLCARKAFKDYSSQEKEQICYQHCVLKHVNRKPMTNATLRERFGIEAKNSSQISRIIKDALSKNATRKPVRVCADTFLIGLNGASIDNPETSKTNALRPYRPKSASFQWQELI